MSDGDAFVGSSSSLPSFSAPCARPHCRVNARPRRLAADHVRESTNGSADVSCATFPRNARPGESGGGEFRAWLMSHPVVASRPGAGRDLA